MEEDDDDDDDDDHSVFGEGDNVGGTATRWRLKSPKFESLLWQDSQHPSTTSPGHTQAPEQWLPRSFVGTKRKGHGVNHSPRSIAEFKKKVDLYVYSPSGSSRPVLG